MSRIWLAALSVGINILALAVPLALLQVYDRILPNQSRGTSIVLFSAVLIALISGGFFRYMRSTIQADAAAREEYRQWTRAGAGLVSGRLDATGVRRTMTAISLARGATGGQTIIAYYDAPFAILFFLLVWFLGGWLVLAPLCVSLVFGLILMARLSGYGAALEAEAAAESEEVRLLSRFVSAPERSGTLGSGARLMADLGRWRRARAAASERSQRFSAMQLDLMQSGGIIATVAVVGFGGVLVLDGGMTTGGLAACTLLGARGASQLLALFSALGSRMPVAQASQVIETTFEGSRSVFRAPDPGDPQAEGAAGLRVNLDNGPHEIAPGAMVLLAAGTPELEVQALDRIARLVWDGGRAGTGETIEIAGRPVDAATLASRVVLVPARPVLQTGTLLDNLTGFDPARSEAAVDLSEAIGLDMMIGRLAHGYATEVSAGAPSPLSPGGVKRLALAAALARSPALLLLERPAVALDADGIARLSRMLDALDGQTTVIMTTHAAALRDITTDFVDLDTLGRGEFPETTEAAQ